MSDLAQLAYMGANEDFDLPRWQTQAHLDPLSSSAQAAQSASQPSYIYGGSLPPPPSSAPSGSQRMPQQIQQSSTGSSRQQARISQLLETNQAVTNPSSYGSGAQLSRSASFGGGSGANTSSASRGRRHHQQDDLEGAFTSDSQPAARRNMSTATSQHSFYAPSVTYHSASASPNPGTSPAADSYANMYFELNPTPKASQQTQDSARSPLRVSNASSAPHLDPYSQQSPYSPTTVPYSYNSSSGTTYHAHTRSNSNVKAEVMTPPPLAYSPMQTSQTNTSGYSSSSYAMDTSSPHPTSSHGQTHLSAHPLQRQTSTSSPSTPLSYTHASQTSPGQYYQEQSMTLEASPPRQRRASGFRRLRDARDLRPYVNPQPQGRRMDANGVYLSPLRQLTTNIVDTYHICNPAFRYESTHNPRRVLTKPSKPMHNDGYDNDDYDYILYVNDWLGTEDGHKYLILDILGQGTFGQVVKCQNMKTHEIVAVKVVKNKPAYFNQSMMEVTILEMLNKNHDPHDEHHILRLRDSFIHRNHLCLVFELLSSNLYELIKQNQFQGLSTQLVKVFTAQLLDALTVLKEARLIHCDLKPENILLKSLQSPQIKVIDFGSACHERQTVYTYIQSRFYRSPEVLLGIQYTAAIDMWSLGCIAVELFLGLPLFPGTSEYNQITRIVEMLGMPPSYMMDMGKQTNQFFDSYVDGYGQKKYRLKSLEQYSREHNTNEQPGKQYFKANSLPEIINSAPMPTFKSSSRQELNNRASFIDFCQGLLNLNPIERWSPQQARMHPFITGEKFTKPFTPPGQPTAHLPTSTPTSTQDPKRPYGGLVPSQPKGTRAYQDAATYNHHLAQHQAYTAQAQAASQAANNSFRNPYIAQQATQSQAQSTSSYAGSQETAAPGFPTAQPHQTKYPTQAQAAVAHQNPGGSLVVNTAMSQYQGQGSPLNPNPPSNSYYPGARARANTINQMDAVPPALARLQHMNQDVIQGRNALTPVLNRDDAIREWERRQSGKAIVAQPYPQLEYLHQQAEMAAASGLTGWHQSSGRFPPPPSKLAQSYHPQTVAVDEERRDAVMSNVRTAARADGPGAMYGTSATIPAPPQTYTSGATTSGNRYAATYAAQQGSASPFDTLEQRTDIGNMYVPMQPSQYPAYSREGQPAPAGSASTRHIAPPSQTLPTSFYGAGVVPAGQPTGGSQQRVPFPGEQSQQMAKDNRRNNSMDVWPR